MDFERWEFGLRNTWDCRENIRLFNISTHIPINRTNKDFTGLLEELVECTSYRS